MGMIFINFFGAGLGSWDEMQAAAALSLAERGIQIMAGRAH